MTTSVDSEKVRREEPLARSVRGCCAGSGSPAIGSEVASRYMLVVIEMSALWYQVLGIPYCVHDVRKVV